MDEPILSDTLRQALIDRLREREPWMRIDNVHQVVTRCSKLLEDEVENQRGAIAAARTRTGFLSLPAELRTRIYEWVLVPQDTAETYREEGCVMTGSPAIPLGTKCDTPNPRGLRVRPPCIWAFQPAITQTCRLIRTETLPMYYGANEFIAYVDDGLDRRGGQRMNVIRFPHAQRWLRAIGPENWKLLKTVSIKGGPLNYRWVSARRFLAIMAKEGIVLPDGVVKNFYLKPTVDEFGRPDVNWVEATTELEEQHSEFGDKPEKMLVPRWPSSTR